MSDSNPKSGHVLWISILALVAVIVVVVSFLNKNDDPPKLSRDAAIARRIEIVQTMQKSLGTVGGPAPRTFTTRGPESDAMVVDELGCSKRLLRSLIEYAILFKSLAEGRFVTLECASGDDELTGPWGPQ